MQELVQKGFGKMVAEFDGKLASAAGDKRALSRANVEEYLGAFGLDAELASHSHIKGLSGGQKVKLVLAAAMWNHPHFLIMDGARTGLGAAVLVAWCLVQHAWCQYPE